MQNGEMFIHPDVTNHTCDSRRAPNISQTFASRDRFSVILQAAAPTLLVFKVRLKAKK
jgi:hypothetical protein